MSSEPIQGEPRRRLIAVTRRRVALAAAALLGALWLALVGRLQAGDDPALKEGPSGAAAETKTETTTTETTTTEAAPAQTETTPAQTETTATEPETKTETTEQETTEEQPSASTTEQS